MRVRDAVIAVFVAALGCARPLTEDQSERLLRKHVLAFDSTCSPVDPVDHGLLDDEGVKDCLDTIESRLRAWVDVPPAEIGDNESDLADALAASRDRWRGDPEAGTELRQKLADPEARTEQKVRDAHQVVYDWLVETGCIDCAEVNPDALIGNEPFALFQELERAVGSDEALLLNLEDGDSPKAAEDEALGSVRDFIERHQDGDRARERPRRGVVVFIHGGLNDLATSQKRAQDYARDVLRCGYYPVFVSWDSGLVTSYGSNLAFEDGEFSPLAVAAAPYRIATDIVSGVLDVPRRTFRALVDLSGGGSSLLADEAERSRHQLLSREAERPPSIDEAWYRDGDLRSAGVSDYMRYSSWSPHFLLLPLRMVSWIPLQLFGTSAWHGMLRNSQRLTNIDYGDQPGSGHERALLALLRRLKTVEDSHPELEFILVGHSMGAIVVNDVLRQSTWMPAPNFDRVIFMGAACSVKDYEENALPYLERNQQTRFHHLVLHPAAERSEVNLWYAGPRGSLLMFLDHAFIRPVTARDRTLGRYDNLLPSLAALPDDDELRDRMHVHVMDAGRDARNEYAARLRSNLAGLDGLAEDEVRRIVDEHRSHLPEGHGDFSQILFWTRAFRE